MPTLHDDPAALQALQDAIYRDKVLRARGMTEAQRLEEVCDLSNSGFARMHEGVMWQLGTKDAAAGWTEVRRRLERLQRVHDFEFYTTTNPRP